MSSLHRNLAALVGLALLTSATSAEAKLRLELKPQQAGWGGVELAGHYRLLGTALSDFPVDAEGNSVGQKLVLDQRLRARFDLQVKGFQIGTEWDLLTGQIAGDLWQVPGVADERGRWQYGAVTLDGFTARRLALTANWDANQVEVGLVTSHWGLGMVANDGAHESFFGRADGGDRVIRLRYTTRPLYGAAEPHPERDHLFFSVAADLVAGDDLARLSKDQLAFQGILSLLYRDAARGFAQGIYIVYRSQSELQYARRTDAFVIDGYYDRYLPLGGTGWGLRLAAEGALILGSTDRALTYNARSKVAVASGGVVGQVALLAPEQLLGVHLRAGWGSGDRDPDDGVTSGFTFDKNYNVGSVLFDQVRGSIDAATYALVSDPQYSGQPPVGADALVGEGAIARTFYVQPVVTVQPAKRLNVRAGVLFAASSDPIPHPFYTARSGGSPTTHLNEPAESRYLGTEVDWAVELNLPVAKRSDTPVVALALQGGHAFLGGALAGGGVDAVHQGMLMARFGW